jgi:lipoprotein-anchoring transpeptidase ErfK/SrfK
MPRKTLIVLVVSVGALLVAAAGVFAYDEAQKDRIADGVSVAGVNVGGQTGAEAAATLERELGAPLRRTVVVRAGGRTFRLTAKEAKTSVDLDASVRSALVRSRTGNPVVRTWRSITGGEIDATITPDVQYDHDAVSRLVDRVRVRTERKPRDAKVEFTPTSMTVQSARTGKAVNTQNLRDAVKLALADPQLPREISATMRKVKPKVGTAEVAKKYPTVVTVDRGGFTLRLFKNLKLAKAYPIAVGQAGLETPAGLYKIENKAVNPAWHVPNSDWAGDLAGTVVPPGPSNPIKSRWLGIYAGAGIHGTDARGSIGTNASHGCVRMLVEDVEELYDRVPVGTPVYIA